MKRIIIGLFAAVLTISMIGCKEKVDEVSYIGTKAPKEAKAVGDIVFNDGSTTSYTAELTLTDEKKTAAIAVIYKVDGTTPYGVGIVHNRNGLAWCSGSANARNKNIETIQCKPDDGGSKGNFTFTNATDTDGSNNLEQIAAFLSAEGSGTTNDTKGDGASDRYPAFYFAKNYKNQTGSHVTGTAYENGWYLPTLAELFDIYKEKTTVDAALDKCGGSKFNGSGYWSSSQYPFPSSVDKADAFAFSDGQWGDAYKFTDGLYVCCIRAFN